MRDRVGAVGGELTIVSEPGRGTTVEGVVHGCAPAA
jgi:signal transduction histidine kinase